MKSVIDWFNGKRVTKHDQALGFNASNLNSSGFGELEESLLESAQIRNSELNDNKNCKRFFVFSICPSDDQIIEDSNKGLNIEPIKSLFEAIMISAEMLRPDDYVCFNIANSSIKLFSDQ